MSRVQPGSIVLFHNAALHTPEALPAILETLLQEGYTFVPISELILPGEYNVDYTIDHTGRQLPAQHRHPPDKSTARTLTCAAPAEPDAADELLIAPRAMMSSYSSAPGFPLNVWRAFRRKSTGGNGRPFYTANKHTVFTSLKPGPRSILLRGPGFRSGICPSESPP